MIVVQREALLHRDGDRFRRRGDVHGLPQRLGLLRLVAIKTSSV